MDRIEKINENLNKLTRYLKLGKVYKPYEEWEYAPNETGDDK